jgi:hypothetical protein
LFIRELAKIMAAATDDVPDVAAVVVEERVTTVLVASGTESEKETVEVESTSIVQVEKKNFQGEEESESSQGEEGQVVVA